MSPGSAASSPPPKLTVQCPSSLSVYGASTPTAVIFELLITDLHGITRCRFFINRRIVCNTEISASSSGAFSLKRIKNCYLTLKTQVLLHHVHDCYLKFHLNVALLFKLNDISFKLEHSILNMNASNTDKGPVIMPLKQYSMNTELGVSGSSISKRKSNRYEVSTNLHRLRIMRKVHT